MNYLRSLLVLLMFSGCQSASDNGTSQDRPQLSPEEEREVLIQRNRARLQVEREEIEAWADSSGIDWLRTGTGLRLALFDSPGGDAIEREEVIRLSYTISLLDGRVVRSSAESGPMIFRVDKDNDAVIGLHEAALLLHKGDSAAVLIPSHLGWGIAGDQMGIPPMSPVLYHIRIQE